MSEKVRYKKYKRRVPFLGRIAIVFFVALFFFLFGIIFVHLCGVRYIVCTRADGSKAKFFGVVNAEEIPTAGTIFYPDGTRAHIRKGTNLVEYSTGAIYQGKLSVSFERTGSGKLLLANGEEYEGDFVKDKPEGYGIYKFINGDIYDGEIRNGKFDGHGLYTYADGEFYEGDFSEGLRDGYGKMSKPDGSTYEGTYVDGVKQGSGKYIYSNGDVYEGEFYKDMKQGKGKYTWANGESYEGEFAMNNINGVGTYTWTDGRASYTGYFVNGEIVIVDPELG